MKYQIEHCVFDSDFGVLMHDGKAQKLRLKVLQLLVCLINKKQQIVTRDELIDCIWQGNHLIGEKALNSVVYTLRAIFKAYFPEKVVIETLPKRGYRFLLNADQLPEQKPSSFANRHPFMMRGNLSFMTAHVFVGCLLITSVMLLPAITGL